MTDSRFHLLCFSLSLSWSVGQEGVPGMGQVYYPHYGSKSGMWASTQRSSVGFASRLLAVSLSLVPNSSALLCGLLWLSWTCQADTETWWINSLHHPPKPLAPRFVMNVPHYHPEQTQAMGLHHMDYPQDPRTLEGPSVCEYGLWDDDLGECHLKDRLGVLGSNGLISSEVSLLCFSWSMCSSMCVMDQECWVSFLTASYLKVQSVHDITL